MKTTGSNKLKTKTERRSLLIYALIAAAVLIFGYAAFGVIQKTIHVSEKAETSKELSAFALLFDKDKKDTPQKPSAPPEQPISKETEEPLMIKSIKLTPANPTVLDSIKAEAITNYDGIKNITYEYRWQVNQKTVDVAKYDILPPGIFKKRDIISVVVAPMMDGKKGHALMSSLILIQNSAPSLEMKEARQKLTDIIEIQLIGKDPDGDKLTYSLEPPLLEGMTIDKETGKIIWKPQGKEKGVYKFTASASDPDGGKITTTFELKIHQ